MDEAEIRKLQWWHDYHKSNVVYLIAHIDAVFAGKEHAEGILMSALVGYRQQYLAEQTGVIESETETETTN